jgi:arylsulfatase A-like enzyme
MVMFDSLNRHMLPPYGCDWVEAPNFQRLADRAVTFDKSFVGSMPCMPARRELHTGRYNFLHRSWGPLEPFDDSMPAILNRHGIHAHLCSDHYHYWEEGGANYHTKYSTWEISRGQEGDPWIPDLSAAPRVFETLDGRPDSGWFRQDCVNLHHYGTREETYPQAVTFAQGEAFLARNREADNWFLHIETFDPHEPYHSPQRFRDLYPDDWDGPHFNWPPYRPVNEEESGAVQHVRKQNAALISFCDQFLGRLLDRMDEYGLWEDTLLIVNTDHGFLLGEHDCWAKCWAPFYNEIAWTPLFIWDPRSGVRGERRQSLVQTIDLPATILDYFGLELPADMQGRPLTQVIEADRPVREAGLFGLHGGHVNVTDGRYVYMRAPEEGAPNEPLYNYTHMPAHMRGPFSVEEMQTVSLAEPFSFTKGCRTMRIEGRGWGCRHNYRTMLFDIEADPRQEEELDDAAAEARMRGLLVQCMEANDAPPEQYQRLGLSRES